MNVSSYYFLVVAEELNISRAAKRLYISQQALSSHIQRLEEQYDVVLFNRKPRLSLTPAGEVLVRNFRRMQVIENGLHEELAEIEHTPAGTVRLGIHASRSRIVVPLVVPPYLQNHPDVEVVIQEGTTHAFEERILAGTLDIFIGLNPSKHPLRHEIKLMDETVYVALSARLLRERLPDFYRRLQSGLLDGVHLAQLASLPFILNHENSNLTSYIQGVLDSIGVSLRVPLQVNGNEMHIELCGQGLGACFVPQLYIPFVTRHNMTADADGWIYLFPVLDFAVPNAFSLVHHAEIYMSQHIRNFIETTVDSFEALGETLAVDNDWKG